MRTAWQFNLGMLIATAFENFSMNVCYAVYTQQCIYRVISNLETDRFNFTYNELNMLECSKPNNPCLYVCQLNSIYSIIDLYCMI